MVAVQMVGVLVTAVALSERMGRQIWICWDGRSMRLHLGWRPAYGALIARVIGDTVALASGPVLTTMEI